jgi:tetratricopeptide (TPR) repeat protein
MCAVLVVTSAWRTASAADPPGRPATQSSQPIISSDQIDRFEAIKELQEKLKTNANSLADWVILGELAHEEALIVPADQAARYNAMALDAYEKALALAPDNRGLKAAVSFARDSQANQAQFAQDRAQLTKLYLETRRRDLASSNYTPAVRLATPSIVSRGQPGTGAGSAVVTPPGSPTSVYTFQPLYVPGNPEPYTYRQYSSAYYPAGLNTPGVLPITAQQYMLMHAIGAPARTVPGRTVPAAPVIPARPR